MNDLNYRDQEQIVTYINHDEDYYYDLFKKFENREIINGFIIREITNPKYNINGDIEFTVTYTKKSIYS